MGGGGGGGGFTTALYLQYSDLWKGDNVIIECQLLSTPLT